MCQPTEIRRQVARGEKYLRFLLGNNVGLDLNNTREKGENNNVRRCVIYGNRLRPGLEGNKQGGFQKGTFLHGKEKGLGKAPHIYQASTRHWADIISDHSHDKSKYYYLQSRNGKQRRWARLHLPEAVLRCPKALLQIRNGLSDSIWQVRARTLIAPKWKQPQIPLTGEWRNKRQQKGFTQVLGIVSELITKQVKGYKFLSFINGLE